MTEISLNVSVKVSELYVTLYDLNMRNIWSKKCASQLSLYVWIFSFFNEKYMQNFFNSF